MSLGIASLALAAGSGALSAGASYAQGQTEKAVADVNARGEENAAIQANMEAIEQMRRQRQYNRSVRGSLTASLAASGAVASTGSPLEILAETAARQQLALNEDARAAAGARDRAFAGAAQTRYGGRMARRAGTIAAVGGLLSTAGNVGGQYVQGRRIGVYK